jgi:hypothetical protein
MADDPRHKTTPGRDGYAATIHFPTNWRRAWCIRTVALVVWLWGGRVTPR